jgi:uncharacterized membrane protein
VWRAFGWLGIVALAVAARWCDSDVLRAACAFLVLALIGASAPRALRIPLGLTALVALALVASAGVGRLFDLLPALIAGLIAWIFARSLARGHTPLIARAIAAVDGAAQLEDPAVARYARRLTWVWAIYQTALAAIALLLARPTAGGLAWLPIPCISARWFGAVVLPLAVAALFFGEFGMRRWLLPQAPRHSLIGFTHALIRVWPRLLDD